MGNSTGLAFLELARFFLEDSCKLPQKTPPSLDDPMSKGHKLGRWGEDMARHFLEMCGYLCLQQQYRKPGGEIDLIVRRGYVLVFVEVKTRGAKSLAPPESWVDGRKIARLKQTARHWLLENPMKGIHEYRFDVVAVEFHGDDRGMKIRHLAGID